MLLRPISVARHLVDGLAPTQTPTTSTPQWPMARLTAAGRFPPPRLEPGNTASPGPRPSASPNPVRRVRHGWRGEPTCASPAGPSLDEASYQGQIGRGFVHGNRSDREQAFQGAWPTSNHSSRLEAKTVDPVSALYGLSQITPAAASVTASTVKPRTAKAVTPAALQLWGSAGGLIAFPPVRSVLSNGAALERLARAADGEGCGDSLNRRELDRKSLF
jgi:hypothetical protein